ncbi:MAG: nucleoside deaminase [Micrococcales bacterium]|nr:nucleoside deaminase [Micrococcales bacterium]
MVLTSRPARPLDEWAMGVALDEARRALLTGDVPVGAVVVAPGAHVVGWGRNAREDEGDPTAHAEIVALRDAAANLGHWHLDECELVVTLEPCLMCAGAVLASHVHRLVFGAWDPKAGAVGSQWDVIRDRRALSKVEVITGVRADESAQLLQHFFEVHRSAD